MKINILILLLLVTICLYPTISNAESPTEKKRAEILAEIHRYIEQNRDNLTTPYIPKPGFDLFLEAAKLGSAYAQEALAFHYLRINVDPSTGKRDDYAYRGYLEPGVKGHIQKNSAIEANAWLILMFYNPEYRERAKKHAEAQTYFYDGEGITFAAIGIAEMFETHPEWCKEAADKAQNYYEHYLFPYYPNLKPHLEQPLILKTDSKTCP